MNRPLTAALRDVAAERERQIDKWEYDASHDDMATRGQMACAAACYAAFGLGLRVAQQAKQLLWPWDAIYWKPKTHRQNLVKAGALILAEIERLDRAEAKATHGPHDDEFPALPKNANLDTQF